MKIEIDPLLLVMPFYWLCLCNHVFVVSGLCHDDQWPLLLQFKHNLTFNSQSSRMESWDPSHDCCMWLGVTCNEEGHVTGLDLSGESISGGFDNSSSLFSLQHLQKLNLAANNFNSVIPSGFNKLEELTYLNLSYARFVGQIPIEISKLTRLVTLDISSPISLIAQELELEIPNLQKLVQNLTSIRQLYLDGVSITAQGQEWSNALLSLCNLQELSMQYCSLSGPLDSSLTRLENLSVIILDGNDFLSPVPETFTNFKKLTTLSLAMCELTGKFPPKIFQIGTLKVIDLSFNRNLHGSFPEFPLSGSLQTFRVHNTNFSGVIPHTIGNMRHLSELDLSNCLFNATLPNSLSNLTKLSYLDLSSNNFMGPIPSSSHFEGLHNLVRIDLSHNSINGSIPSSLFTLPLLDYIDLSFNKFSKLDELINVSSSVLNTLDLSNNNLSGPFPTFIFQLSSLSVLELSYNNFNESLQLDKLLELKNLTTIDLSYNNVSVNANVANADQLSFPNIGTLNLESCNLKTFPGFLRNKSRLTYLDLSHNQIQGTVPNWIWKLQNLQSLNISHNLLTDLEGPLQNLTSNLITTIDLHNNRLQGPIPVFPIYASYLDYSMNKFDSVIPQDIGNYMPFTFFLSLSNNNLHGNIPYSLCNASNLQLLDLSMNNISGTIPSCLMTMTEELLVLNLRKNNLIGPIPDMFPASCGLRTLNLHENLLHGPIPKSLANCTTLEVLDIGTNQMVGGFPCFLNEIPTLRVLVLRNNIFQGSIRCLDANKPWQMIQIVDIAVNNFSGKLAGKYFTTWDKMMHDEDHSVLDFIHMDGNVYYQDSVRIFNKGQQMEFGKILRVFTAIDLSSNHFEGPIPNVLMDFKALHVLNFSNNDLSGEIPSSIGNLKQLESLDLSSNSLGGKIHVQLASLSFLSYLNLSFNHLVGQIPTGTQLQSFNTSSFEGNDGLYGPPLTECERLACSVDWNFISVELGFFLALELSLVLSCLGSNGGYGIGNWWTKFFAGSSLSCILNMQPTEDKLTQF